MSQMPIDIIGRDALDKLRAAGWVAVKADAIRLAQAAAREECRQENKEAGGCSN